MTPLHWAVQRGFGESVEILLRYGADVSIENKFGKTPFEIASGINRTDIIELLQVIGLFYLLSRTNYKQVHFENFE